MTTSAPTAGVIPNAVQIKLHAMDEQFLRILNKLESWDTPAKRREVIPNHEERSASSSLGFQGTEAMET